MKKSKGLVRGRILAAVFVAVFFLLAGVAARAQGEKRTVFAPEDFHWQGNLKAGQTLEVINTNGEIGANRASGDSARVEGIRSGNDDDHELFIEVVEYAEGVTVCAVYARDKAPGRCRRGGVSSESGNWWHSHRAKINFDAQVPRGVRLNAFTTNGSVDVTLPASAEFQVDAATTNGGIQTDFPVTVQGRFGPKSLSGTVGAGGRELNVKTTNGGIELKKS